MFECFLELGRRPANRPAGALLDECLRSWTSLHFPTDARSFLLRFGPRETRLGLEALRDILRDAGTADAPAMERAAGACAKAASRFWPDGRADLAARALGLIEQRERAEAPARREAGLAPEPEGALGAARKVKM